MKKGRSDEGWKAEERREKEDITEIYKREEKDVDMIISSRFATDH